MESIKILVEEFNVDVDWKSSVRTDYWCVQYSLLNIERIEEYNSDWTSPLWLKKYKTIFEKAAETASAGAQIIIRTNWRYHQASVNNRPSPSTDK